MSEMQLPELKERLEVLADRGPTRGADDVFVAASSAVATADGASVIHHPRRRVLVPLMAAAVVVALAVSGLVWLRDGPADPDVRLVPASNDLRDLYDTSDQTPLGDPLYLVPGYVPDGLTPFRVQGGNHPGQPVGGGGSPDIDRVLTYVKFDSTGTRPVGMFQVQWGPDDASRTESDAALLRPPTDPSLSADPLAGWRQQSVPDRARGVDAFYSASLNGLAWEEPPGRMVAVSSYAHGGEQLTVDELHQVAESLVARASGFTVSDVPEGYFLVGDMPGFALIGSNPREVVFRADDSRGFRVHIVDDSEESPGINLMPAPAIGGGRDAHLVEIRGHDAVVTRELMSGVGYDQRIQFLAGADQHVQWLEPGNVMVTVSAVGLTEDEVLAIADGLQVVDRAGWEQLLVQAPGLVVGAVETVPDEAPALEGEELAAADAFRAWISPGDLEQLIARIEDGEAIRDVIAESQTRVDNAATYEARIHAVRIVDPDHALVRFSMLRDATPLLEDLEGVAVRVDGRWLVSRATYCAIVAMGGTQCPP